MNDLLLFIIGLLAVAGSLCTVLYSRLTAICLQISEQRDQLNRIESTFHQMLDLQRTMYKRVDQLATDVLQREIYQSADDRHQMAIIDAKEGHGLHELVQKYGLSSDEAALILALHGNRTVHTAGPKPLVEQEASGLVFDLDGEEYR